MKAGSTESNETPVLATTSDTVERAGTASPAMGRAGRLQPGALWGFTRHLLEMLLAMFAGMGVLGAALMLLGEPPGYANLFVKYGLMGVSMSVPMVAWMRYRGHPWSDGLEMTAAMVFPMFALVIQVELGMAVPGLSEESLMMLSHVAMIVGMIALMVYRWDRYAH